MKMTGIVRRVDDLGRVVIPIELRKTLGIAPGTPVEMYTDEDGIIALKKYEPGCVLCGETEGLKAYNGKKFCRECRTAISSL